ncbi:hypothetical protein [Thioalkalivibrio sp.]|uniref:hypothetical protein n=1 Tax=Thioalkalivibrio sp. TaxID=2093813 RepID=UPI0039752CD3
MSLTSEEIEQGLDAASEALWHAMQLIEQARTNTRERSLTLLDEADRSIVSAEGIIDSLHRDVTRVHGPNHMALQFGNTGLALLKAREGVRNLREEALRHPGP